MSLVVVVACACAWLVLPGALSVVRVHGPGLRPQAIVMPARYVFINITDVNEDTYTEEIGGAVRAEVRGQRGAGAGECRVHAQLLDRRDGVLVLRYRVHHTCYQLRIDIRYRGAHVPGSPFTFPGPVLPDECACPDTKLEEWTREYGCRDEVAQDAYQQVERDLKPFPPGTVRMERVLPEFLRRHHAPHANSFCHYVIKDNEVWRRCYGQHVGFAMFADDVLTWLARRARLPDTELLVNLGDWPLERGASEPLPVFSWCGSEDTHDIVWPTYDLTESSLHAMGRVMLDTLTAQSAGSERSRPRRWADREPRAFWRGRDSSTERLRLIDIARDHPDLFNASLTNFFFFRDKEQQYGPKQPHISLYHFFDYKYQVLVDGTVAAYRAPYLLAGGALLLKQQSPYYEHFYPLVTAWLPVRRDLADLHERVQWARENDAQAHILARDAQHFANTHLLPHHVLCYHAVLLQEWSTRLAASSQVRAGMERVHGAAPPEHCECRPAEPRSDL